MDIPSKYILENIFFMDIPFKFWKKYFYMDIPSIYWKKDSRLTVSVFVCKC